MSAIQLMFLLNKKIIQIQIDKSDIPFRIYHPNIYKRKMLQISKDANINVGNIPLILFTVRPCFPCGKLTLNFGYYFNIY